jgi:hypothetical protein
MSKTHHDHDDGLVHGHRWASEQTPPHARRAEKIARPEPDHDDGLVHSHGWACGERGRMAGR